MSGNEAKSKVAKNDEFLRVLIRGINKKNYNFHSDIECVTQHLRVLVAPLSKDENLANP